MNAEALEKELLGKSGLIKRICYFDVTDSTNIRAKNDSDAGNGTLFVADMQEKGRGRMGRIWQSEQGCGIYMSVLLKPKIQLDNVSQLTLAAGLAVTNVLAGYLPGVMIKWPNDVVYNGKKLVGILSEAGFSRDSISYIVVGIGVNVNNPDFSGELESKATSLFCETGKKFSRVKLISEIVSEFEMVYNRFLKDGFCRIKPDYEKKCITLGKKVSVIKKDGSFTAEAVKIDDNGCLVVKCGNDLITVNSGEVSVYGIYGYI